MRNAVDLFYNLVPVNKQFITKTTPTDISGPTFNQTGDNLLRYLRSRLNNKVGDFALNRPLNRREKDQLSQARQKRNGKGARFLRRVNFNPVRLDNSTMSERTSR